MAMLWELDESDLCGKEPSIVKELAERGYIIVKKDEFNIGNFVMERLPAKLLPVLIETAGTRLKAIG